MPAPASKPALNKETYAYWRDYLLPSSSELGFSNVGFYTTLWEGVTRANLEDKPILLWAMNGHPMACT
jgi:hypothetical protein